MSDITEAERATIRRINAELQAELVSDMEADVAALLAQRDRYETALRRILALDDPQPTYSLDPSAPASGAYRVGELSPYAVIAREALAAAQEGSNG
jgi:hypothetical protein